MISASACSSFIEDYDDNYGSGYIEVNESEWESKYNAPYPFTVPNGEISCGVDPKFGRTVYFEPFGFIDESYIGIPLNRSALLLLANSNLKPNVPYSIKKKADLSTAIKIGLKICDEQKEVLKKNSYF